jgi:hypothetical protein
VLSVDESRILGMLGPADAPLTEELSYRAKVARPRTGEIVEALGCWGLSRVALAEGGRRDFRVRAAVATLCRGAGAAR